MDLITFLQAAASSADASGGRYAGLVERLGSDYALGHSQATGGMVDADVFAILLQVGWGAGGGEGRSVRAWVRRG